MVHSCALSRTFFAQYRLLFLEAPRKMRPYLDPRGRRTFQNQHSPIAGFWCRYTASCSVSNQRPPTRPDCILYRVSIHLSNMIKTFRHNGIEKFFITGSKAGIQPKHARKLEEQLSTLNYAVRPEDMNLPGWDGHPLKSDLAEHWTVSVNGNWRLTFSFEGSDATLVDYQDYH